MKENILENIHQKTVQLLEEVNAQLDSENKLGYNGQFYSGSLNPEILFVGYNPGGEPCKKSHYNSFELKEIKYIDEKKDNLKLAKEIYFIIENVMGLNAEEYLKNKTAEINFIHFNTPNIDIYKKNIKNLKQDTKNKLSKHFIKSFEKIINIIKPKVIFIIGMRTYDELNKKKLFNIIKEFKDKNGHRLCYKAILDGKKINVVISKHLSSTISDSDRGLIGADCLKEML